MNGLAALIVAFLPETVAKNGDELGPGAGMIRVRGRRWIVAGVFLFAAAAPFGWTNQRKVALCRGFLPANDVRIPAGAAAGGISEADYNAVLDRVEQVYAPIVAARGARLQIRRGWKEASLQTYSERWGNTWGIRVYGALARHPAMTKEGFALAVCHEVGHHLGGYPLWGQGFLASNEGQADYFAASKCLRRVLPATADGAADPVVTAACASAFPDEAGRSRCRLGAMAGLSAARVHRLIQAEPRDPSFATPDRAVVELMFPMHPAAQCRLDTYLQGALCAKPVEEDVSMTDPVPGACTAKGGFRVGLRPRCWYKPPADEPDPPTVGSTLGAEATRRRLRALGDALSGRGF